MQFAIDFPLSGQYNHPRLLAELAREAENAGWDGCFVWDHLQFEQAAANRQSFDSPSGDRVNSGTNPFRNTRYTAVPPQSMEARAGNVRSTTCRRDDSF